MFQSVADKRKVPPYKVGPFFFEEGLFLPMILKKIILFSVVFFNLFSFSFVVAGTSPSEEETDKVLFTAEHLFKAMKGKAYKEIWQNLTEKSKKSITNAVYKEEKKIGRTPDKEAIEIDFKTGGAMAKSYWDAYLNVFNPDLVLEKSKWSIGIISKNKAEINILYQKSDKPALLQLYKEDNRWKVGIEETFGARNMLP